MLPVNSPIKQYIYFTVLAGIILLAALLRFWNLGELQQLVFDEVYFPKNGHNYLTGTYFFDVHPPLSKYLIGAGIWLHNTLAWTADPPFHMVELDKLSAVSWRWLNAVTGTVLCLVVARLAFLLYPNRLFSLLCALFIAIDGTFLVESRFGMNNIYLALFGVWGLLYLVKMLRDHAKPRTALAICGIFLGCTYSVKWNGLGFSLAAWIIVCLFLLPQLRYFADKQSRKQSRTDSPHHDTVPGIYPLPSTLQLWHYPLYLVVIPFIVYSIIWQPHLAMFDKHGFVEMQKQILGYHSNSVTSNEHPYCSKWYTWPLLIRPIGYFFSADNGSANKAEHVFTDVHLLGNPFIFWLGALAILYVTLLWLRQLYQYLRGQPVDNYFLLQTVLVAGFYANWLPWSIVNRCIFQYHYMSASVFAFMALAWWISDLLRSGHRIKQSGGVIMLLLIAFGFLFWLPLQLGLPLHPDSFYDRIWIRSWI